MPVQRLNARTRGGRLGIADQIGDLFEPEVGFAQVLLGEVLSNGVAQGAEAFAAFAEAALEGLAAHAELRGHRVDMDGAAGQALDDQRTHVVDDVLLLRRRPEDLPAGHLQDLEQLVVRADDGHLHRLGLKDDGIPVRPEADRAAQVGLVVDPGIGPGVHELRPDGRDPPARHVAAGANDEGGEILGILAQPAQGRIALAEAQLHMRAALVDLDVFAVSDHEKVSLEVAHRIEKRRRIQHHEAQDAAVADVLGGAEAKAESRLAEQRGGALHQRDDGGVADPRIGVAQVGPADTRFLQQVVDRKILPLEIVDDLGCQACMDPGGSDHCRHSAQLVELTENVNLTTAKCQCQPVPTAPDWLHGRGIVSQTGSVGMTARKPSGPGSFASLKAKQRALRAAFPEPLGLRVHRAISWLGRAEAEKADADVRFILLWVAFNSAYASEIDADATNERKSFKAFFDALVSLDASHRIYDAVWERFSQEIRLLLANRYVFAPFWHKQNGLQGHDDWEEKLAASQRQIATAMTQFDTGRILLVVFDRLYVLRNQLVHGGATWNSSINRAQVKDGAAVLGWLLPVFIDIMLENPDQDWGKPFYPVVKEA